MHSRFRGSCHSGLPSALSRVAQMGSWWLTRMASAPSPPSSMARTRASWTAAMTRAACCLYGSPQEGRNGLHSLGQCFGLRSSALETWSPSK